MPSCAIWAGSGDPVLLLLLLGALLGFPIVDLGFGAAGVDARADGVAALHLHAGATRGVDGGHRADIAAAGLRCDLAIAQILGDTVFFLQVVVTADDDLLAAAARAFLVAIDVD